MFLVFGILSILAGVFVFKQGTALSVLSGFVNSKDASAVSGAFLIVAICLLISGICGCVCKSGEKRGVVKAAIVFYFIASAMSLIFQAGDLKIWAVVCLIIGIIYCVKLHTLSSENNGDSESATSAVESSNGSFYGYANNPANQSPSSVNEHTRGVIDEKWVADNTGFYNCPDCGRHMSKDFIQARGTCPSCGCSFWKMVASAPEAPAVNESAPIMPIENRASGWIVDVYGFCNCPKCGKHMSKDFIQARGKCSACGYEFTGFDTAEESSNGMDSTAMPAEWVSDADGFVNCPDCGSYMSLDYIRAKGKCPKCGKEYVLSVSKTPNEKGSLQKQQSQFCYNCGIRKKPEELKTVKYKTRKGIVDVVICGKCLELEGVKEKIVE